MQAQAFLERHTPRLIEIANASTTPIPGGTDVGGFLAKVHADFETVADKPGRRPSLPGEDAFWWCVTILEELAELPAGAAARDPYVAMMRDQLRGMGRRLGAGSRCPTSSRSTGSTTTGTRAAATAEPRGGAGATGTPTRGRPPSRRRRKTAGAPPRNPARPGSPR